MRGGLIGGGVGGMQMIEWIMQRCLWYVLPVIKCYCTPLLFFLPSCRTWFTFSDRTATPTPPLGFFFLLVLSTSSACGVGVGGTNEVTRASTTFQVRHVYISVHGAKHYVYYIGVYTRRLLCVSINSVRFAVGSQSPMGLHW